VLAVAAAADRTGRWVAAASGAVAIGTGLGPIAAGWILDAVDTTVFGAVLAVATLAAAVPLLRTALAAARGSNEEAHQSSDMLALMKALPQSAHLAPEAGY